VLIEPAMPSPEGHRDGRGPRYAPARRDYSSVESFLYTRPVVYYGVIIAAILAGTRRLFFVLRRWRARRRSGK
jgi:hypothetical protein